LNFSTKSLPFLSRKNSQVIHSKFVSSNPHHLYAKRGILQAKASTGTIQKSSSQGKISHFAFCKNPTKLSEY
jgi:hypothetical protein